MKKNKFHEWLTIITISLIMATINVFHVIIGQAKTPIGFTYMATGHYYLDYFVYLQYIAMGIGGRWMPTNYFTISPSPVDWRFFPYILMGKIAWIFHFSPVFTYWLVVFVLSFLTLIGFYYLINLMIPKENFLYKIIAFLIAIFSGPVYQVLMNNGQLILNPYDFWYGPATFIRRFGAVPYHTLGLFLLILIIAVINKIWIMIIKLSNKEIIVRGFLVAVLINMLMTFSPIALASLIPSLLIISTIRFLKNKNDRLKIFLFNAVILTLTVPVAFMLRRNLGYGGMSFEVNWISHDPWWFVLLNLGLIILFFPFGFKKYLQEDNFLRQILLTFVLVSYCLFISPLAYYLGIHNLRFLSSINYVCYGVLAVLGIKNISLLFKKYNKIAMIMIASVLILYSGFFTFDSLNKRLLGLNQAIPETIWTYTPTQIIEGLQSLRNSSQTNVLTGPYGGIGILVPIFSYRRVYAGHPNTTPNIVEKQLIANRFYTGQMTDKEAINFLKINKIGFVILTTYDNFDVNIISRYSFLKPIYTKESIIIWKVI